MQENAFPAQQDQQQHRLQLALHVSSQKGLLSSTRRTTDDQQEEHAKIGSGCNNQKNLSILVPESLSVNNLTASGTLRWRHILFPVQAFHRIRDLRERKSQETPSSSSFREGVTLPLVGEVKWEDLWASSKNWLRNPKNLALLLWGLAVGISGAMLFLIMVGFLDHAIRSKSQRDAWFEANNQILNALFALMCLYLHPQRLLHLFLLYRWEPDDIKKLRDVYCKDGMYKPHEWSSMLVVVLLLNLNCFAQYALCGLNWGYRRSDRPVIGVGICLAVAIGAPAAAGVYSILSPLSKDYEEDEEHLEDREESEKMMRKTLKNKPSVKIGRGWKLANTCSFAERDGTVIKQPVWRGGLFDVKSDPQVTVFTIFCGFCVFGWNMERLGFGNRFVHIVTFILLCTAPYWIFFLAATNIDNPYVQHGLSYGGIVLCIFGLLYGGFWRIQMRKTYGLPAQTWCFGKAGLTDCIQWLFCSLCALCQEVRTSEAYKIGNNKFYERYRSSPLHTENSTPTGSDSMQHGLSRLGGGAGAALLPPAIATPLTRGSGNSSPQNSSPLKLGGGDPAGAALLPPAVATPLTRGSGDSSPQKSSPRDGAQMLPLVATLAAESNQVGNGSPFDWPQVVVENGGMSSPCQEAMA